MSSLAVTTLSSKYQISIPKSVRDDQHWKPGQKFAFVPRGRGYVPVPTRDELFGFMAGANADDHRDRNDRY